MFSIVDLISFAAVAAVISFAAVAAVQPRYCHIHLCIRKELFPGSLIDLPIKL